MEAPKGGQKERRGKYERAMKKVGSVILLHSAPEGGGGGVMRG